VNLPQQELGVSHLRLEYEFQLPTILFLLVANIVKNLLFIESNS